MFILVGLGNPGLEYENTRHNTGRIVLEVFRKANDFPEWAFNKKLNAIVSEGRIGKEKILLACPETFMNKSGETLKQIKDLRFSAKGGSASGGKDKKKEIANLAVVHDDLDIPFGSYKISFNKSSGGHRGAESIVKAVKTQAFVRVRVGIASSASAVKKSQDEKTVEKAILGKFGAAELTALKKLSKRIAEGLAVLVTEDRDKAMSQYHS